MPRKKDAIEITLGAVLLVLALVVYGWAISLLWGWFIAPQFHINTLNIWQAVGLATLLKLLSYRYTAESNYEKPSFSKLSLTNVVVSLFAAGFGWLLLQAMIASTTSGS